MTIACFAVIVIAATVDTTTTARAFGGNRGVYATVFYGAVLPWLFRGGLVLWPAWLGMRRSQRRDPIALRFTLVTCAAVIGLTMWIGHGLEASLVFGRGRIPGPGPDGIVGTADDVWVLWWWLPLMMMWPAGYLLVRALRDRRVRNWSGRSEAGRI